MRKLREIDVPPRFVLYVIVVGAAIWLVRNDVVTIAYAVALVAIVVGLIWKGKAAGGNR